MKIFLLLLLSSICLAQDPITYMDLKNITDGNMSEAVSIMKSKGMNYSDSNEKYVIYSKSNNEISLSKYINGDVQLYLYYNRNEYISKNILNTIKKLGYKELKSTSDQGGFCSIFESTNYNIIFCDSNLELSNKETIPMYIVGMVYKKNYE